MPRLVVLLSLVAVLLAPSRAFAQRPDMNDPDFARMATALVTYEHFATRCAASKGMSERDAAQVEAWRTANRVELVRSRMRELELDPLQKGRIDQARADVVKKFGTFSFLACRAALQATKQAEAQFAANAPRVLAALGAAAPATASATSAQVAPLAANIEAPARVPPTPTPALAPDTTAAPTAAAPPRAPLLESIDSFGFDTRPKMGVGGFIALDIYPIVLFRNGEVLTDVTGLSFPAGLAAHKRAHPDDWTRWRRSGGRLQLAKASGWDVMEFQTTYDRLPDGFRLDGAYRHLSGAGTLAVGGTQEVVAWNEYRFWSDGRVVRGGGAGGRAEAGNASVATSSVAPNRRGRYRVEGLTLRITYDDGSVESRLLITDPSDPRPAIWLDGVGYARTRGG